MFTFGEWVEGVNHELEDAIPHEAVVQGGGASAALQTWLGLSRETRQRRCQLVRSERQVQCRLDPRLVRWSLTSVTGPHAPEPKIFTAHFEFLKGMAFSHPFFLNELAAIFCFFILLELRKCWSMC